MRSTSVHLRWGAAIAGAHRALSIGKALAEPMQMRVDRFNGTTEAIAAFQRRSPCVVLADFVQLSAEDLSALARFTRTREIPVVIFVPPGESISAAIGFDTARLHVLAQDASTNRLIESVRQAMTRKQPSPTA